MRCNLRYPAPIKYTRYIPPRRPVARPIRPPVPPRRPARPPLPPPRPPGSDSPNYRALLMLIAMLVIPNCICALIVSPVMGGGQFVAQTIDAVNRLLILILGFDLYRVFPGLLTFILTSLRDAPPVLSAFMTTMGCTVLCCVVPIGSLFVIFRLLTKVTNGR